MGSKLTECWFLTDDISSNYEASTCPGVKIYPRACPNQRNASHEIELDICGSASWKLVGVALSNFQHNHIWPLQGVFVSAYKPRQLCILAHLDGGCVALLRRSEGQPMKNFRFKWIWIDRLAVHQELHICNPSDGMAGPSSSCHGKQTFMTAWELEFGEFLLLRSPPSFTLGRQYWCFSVTKLFKNRKFWVFKLANLLHHNP